MKGGKEQKGNLHAWKKKEKKKKGEVSSGREGRQPAEPDTELTWEYTVSAFCTLDPTTQNL